MEAVRTCVAVYESKTSRGTKMTVVDNSKETALPVSHVRTFAENVVGAADSSRPRLERATAAASALSVGSELAPAALRLLRRYPFLTALAVAGAIWAVTAARSRRPDA